MHLNFGGGGGISPFVLLGVVIFIVALAYFVFIRNPNFLKNLGAGRVGAAMGASVPGPKVYPVVGPITTEERTRCNTAGCGEGSGDNSFRDNVGFPCAKCNRETTWFFVPGTSSGEPCKDLSIKMGSHGDEGTTLISFRQIPLEGSGGEWKSEGPHDFYRYNCARDPYQESHIVCL